MGQGIEKRQTNYEEEYRHKVLNYLREISAAMDELGVRITNLNEKYNYLEGKVLQGGKS